MGKKKKKTVSDPNWNYFEEKHNSNQTDTYYPHFLSTDLEYKDKLNELYLKNQFMFNFKMETAEPRTKFYTYNNKRIFSYLELLKTGNWSFSKTKINLKSLPSPYLNGSLGKTFFKRPRKRWKIVHANWTVKKKVILSVCKRRKHFNYRQNKQKLHMFCDSYNGLNHIDTDPPPTPTSKLKAYIAILRHWYCKGPTIISNGSLSVRIPDSFWVAKDFNTWTSPNPNEDDFLDFESKFGLYISKTETLISSLQFIHKELLGGSYPNAILREKTLLFISITRNNKIGPFPTMFPSLVDWINTWLHDLWPLHTEAYQTLVINIKNYWRVGQLSARTSRSPQGHTLHETLLDLEYISLKLHYLLHYTEKMHYHRLLYDWNESDTQLIPSQSIIPTTDECMAAQLILESALKHMLHALSHTNRIFGKRELNQSIATATQQHNLLQPRLNSFSLFELYLLICCNLRACQITQVFTDLDHTVNTITRQENNLCSPWLTKLWSRSKATLIYTYDTRTNWLASRLEAKEYQLALSAISFTDSLPTLKSLYQPATIPSPLKPSKTKETHSQYNPLEHNKTNKNQHAPLKALFSPNLQPLHFALPYPEFKCHIKLLPYPTHYYYGTSSMDPPLTGNFPYALSLLPYRRTDNRTGI